MNYWVIPLIKYRDDVKFPIVCSDFDSECIIEVVCKFYGLKVKDICVKCRKRELVWVRQVCMYFIKQHTTLTLKQIGQRFLGRDHTTAIHSIQTVKDLTFKDGPYREDLIKITHLLNVKNLY